MRDAKSGILDCLYLTRWPSGLWEGIAFLFLFGWKWGDACILRGKRHVGVGKEIPEIV